MQKNKNLIKVLTQQTKVYIICTEESKKEVERYEIQWIEI